MRILSDVNTEISDLQMSKMWSNGADGKERVDGFNKQNRSDNVRRRYARNCIGSNSADTCDGT